MEEERRTRLIWKISVYYGVCLALIFGVGLTHPEWMNYLPFGGLDALENDLATSGDKDLVDQMLATNRPISVIDDALNLVSAMAGTIVVMIPLRWVYMDESIKKSWSREVAASLLVLPLVVTAIVYIVKFSLPLAFALAGIFAGVRYRSTLKSQIDAFFTFACIAVGLSAGTRALGIGVILAFFFALTILIAPPGRDD